MRCKVSRVNWKREGGAATGLFASVDVSRTCACWRLLRLRRPASSWTEPHRLLTSESIYRGMVGIHILSLLAEPTPCRSRTKYTPASGLLPVSWLSAEERVIPISSVKEVGMLANLPDGFSHYSSTCLTGCRCPPPPADSRPLHKPQGSPKGS